MFLLLLLLLLRRVCQHFDNRGGLNLQGLDSLEGLATIITTTHVVVVITIITAATETVSSDGGIRECF